MFEIIIVVAAIILVSRWALYPKKRRPTSIHKLQEPPIQRYHLSNGEIIEVGGRCNICREPYVGLAMDCRCTNYGK
jgi:hypothetical protein